MARPRTSSFLPALLLSALALAACGESEPDKVEIGGMQVTAVDTVERPWGTVKVFPKMEKAEEPSVEDITFAADMISHHEQAIRLGRNLLSHEGLDDRLTATARFIVADQGNEIGEMSAWLTAWEADPAEHAGDHHSMPGMLPAQRVKQVRTLPLAESQVAFLVAMIEHHEGAVSMSRDYLAVQSNDYTRKTAQHIIGEQVTEIQYMENLVTELCAGGKVAACPADATAR
ncbi:DUF305 domain-containing protein [Nocardioides sp. J54]|uniref:DUF305 domain-containing protein n=1 Tax=Nocardioides sp. J54 TaxID=935866 RepID=UPI0004B0C520|nr:DUF305 domain-containing protein [Nocardioides sp. J54]